MCICFLKLLLFTTLYGIHNTNPPNNEIVFLILYVGDAARLGGPLPKPTIRYSRQAGEGEWFHYIEVYI